MKRLSWCAGILGVMAALGGCADPGLESLDRALDRTRETVTEPEPLVVPELPGYRPLAYRHGEQRSPFLAPEALTAPGTETPGPSRDGALAPDTSRPKEPLERFALQQLNLVGTLRMGNRQRALVKTPEHDVVSVQVGNHMGNNHGRITRITPDAVFVDERVFTRQDGWEKRQAVLELSAGEPSQ